MLSDKEKEELQELINLLYNGHISQYGKRKLEKYIKKQSKEIEELKENNGYHLGFIDGGIAKKYEYQDKIKTKIEEIEIKLKDYGADKINIFSGQTYMEKFRLLGALYVLQSLLEKE